MTIYLLISHYIDAPHQKIRAFKDQARRHRAAACDNRYDLLRYDLKELELE